MSPLVGHPVRSATTRDPAFRFNFSKKRDRQHLTAASDGQEIGVGPGLRQLNAGPIAPLSIATVIEE
jgi:hypothetical protein